MSRQLKHQTDQAQRMVDVAFMRQVRDIASDAKEHHDVWEKRFRWVVRILIVVICIQIINTLKIWGVLEWLSK